MNKQLSGYRLMWLMVMFDLPVVEEENRKEANRFRKFLEKEGFSMAQFSVYAKFCGTRERMTPIINKINENLPPKGKVSAIQFTDKQHGGIIHMSNRQVMKSKEPPDQLMLFFEETNDLEDNEQIEDQDIDLNKAEEQNIPF